MVLNLLGYNSFTISNLQSPESLNKNPNPKAMKTFKTVSMSLLSLALLISACSKDEPGLDVSSNLSNAKSIKPGVLEINNLAWREDFVSSSSISAHFNLYGTPGPQWVSNAHNRTGLFDNNGSLPLGGYAVSKQLAGNGLGYVIESEVYIDVLNPKSAIISPEIGIVNTIKPNTDFNMIERGISLKLIYYGESESGVPVIFQKQTFAQMSIYTEEGIICSSTDPKVGGNPTNGDNSFRFEVSSNGWHKLKIAVSPKRKVYFYIDNRLVWSPEKLLNIEMMSNKNVFLGYLSPGSGGKTYHDFVEVTYPRVFDHDNLSLPEFIVE